MSLRTCEPLRTHVCKLDFQAVQTRRVPAQDPNLTDGPMEFGNGEGRGTQDAAGFDGNDLEITLL